VIAVSVAFALDVSAPQNRLLVAPTSNPAILSVLNNARIGERSVITAETGPGVRRVEFRVDNTAVRAPAAVRTRAPFVLTNGARIGDAALTPGRHMLTAEIEYRDGSSKTVRSQYTVARLYLAPSGSDAAPCTQTAPCATFQRGYLAAPLGGVVELAGGVYGCNPIVGRRVAAVALRAAANATAQVPCGLEIRAPWVRLERLQVAGGLTFGPGADNSWFSGGSAFNFDIFGADDVTISDSAFDGHGEISHNQIWDVPAGSTPDRFRILGNTFRNFYGPTEDSHSEAIFVGYSTDGLIAGNRFDDNGNTAHLFFTWFGDTANPATSYPRNICVRDNTFGATHGAYWAVSLRGEIPASAGIQVARPPSNKLTADIALTTQKSTLTKTC
jgi:hypothetical protein